MGAVRRRVVLLGRGLALLGNKTAVHVVVGVALRRAEVFLRDRRALFVEIGALDVVAAVRVTVLLAVGGAGSESGCDGDRDDVVHKDSWQRQGGTLLVCCDGNGLRVLLGVGAAGSETRGDGNRDNVADEDSCEGRGCVTFLSRDGGRHCVGRLGDRRLLQGDVVRDVVGNIGDYVDQLGAFETRETKSRLPRTSVLTTA